MNTELVYQLIMIVVGLILIYLAIRKEMEPTLLLPMGFGAILVNLPGSVMLQDNAILQWLFNVGIESAEAFPLLLFIGIGAMIDFDSILESFNLPETVKTYISSALSNIFMLIWQSGIQTILIIAGLQSIPELLYEVAKVEGASKWEELWYITIPMLVRTMMLVIIFTLVELVSSSTNGVITMGYNQMSILQYGRASAILWFYFMIAGLIMALFFLFYNKAFLRRLS